MWDTLGASSAQIQAVSSVLLAVITGLYAYLTFRLLRVAREQMELLARPQLLISWEKSEDGRYFLLVSNIGRSPANNLKLESNQPLLKGGNLLTPIGDQVPFASPLPTLPADCEYRIELWDEAMIREEHPVPGCPSNFALKASYHHMGKQLEESVIIDLSHAFIHRTSSSYAKHRLPEGLGH